MNGEKTIPAGPRVHFELLKAGAGRLVLELSGQLDADETPLLWQELKRKLADPSMTELAIDAVGLTHCDSAGLALLYCLAKGQMTPQAQEVTLSGLRPEFQKALQSFSLEDYPAFLGQQPIKPSVAEEAGMTVAGVAA